MGICHCTSDIAAGNLHKERFQPAGGKGQDCHHQNGSKHIEKEMNQRCPLCILLSAQTGQEGGGTGADITAQNNIETDAKLQKPLLGHQEHDTDRYGRALHNCRHNESHQNSQNGI